MSDRQLPKVEVAGTAPLSGCTGVEPILDTTLPATVRMFPAFSKVRLELLNVPLSSASAGLANAEVENGWTVLATTVEPTQGTAVEILQAYQAQPSTVEPGSRWLKHPAAISPGGASSPHGGRPERCARCWGSWCRR